MLEIGINGRFFPSNWRPALEEIAFAQQHGFTALQFPGKPAGLQPEDLGASFEEVEAALKSAGITAVMEIMVRVDDMGLTVEGTTPLEVFTANLPAIRGLNCRCVHWHVVLRDKLEVTAARSVEALVMPQFKAAVALAAQHSFRFGFEHNEPELLVFATPERCAAALEAVPGLGFVWDFNHTAPEHIAGFQALIPRMTMLHVSDSPLPEVNYHLPLGMGTIDIRGYCEALSAGGFGGPAILEIGGLPKSGGYGRDTDQALIDSAQRLREAATLT